MEYNVLELEKKLIEARKRYCASEGTEWVGLVIMLKVLSETYATEKKIDKASKCIREATAIIEQNQINSVTPLLEPVTHCGPFFDEINYWTRRLGNRDKTINNKKDLLDYAKTVNTLCTFLRPAGMSDVALIKCEEVLRVLLSQNHAYEDDAEMMYITIVILIKTTLCALETRKESLASKYCILPLLYLAEFLEKRKVETSFNWPYIIELCKELISKV